MQPTPNSEEEADKKRSQPRRPPSDNELEGADDNVLDGADENNFDEDLARH